MAKCKKCKKKATAKGLCDLCYARQWHIDNRERRLEYQKEYRRKQKESRDAYNKQYRTDNQEIISERNRRYYQKRTGKPVDDPIYTHKPKDRPSHWEIIKDTSPEDCRFSKNASFTKFEIECMVRIESITDGSVFRNIHTKEILEIGR